MRDAGAKRGSMMGACRRSFVAGVVGLASWIGAPTTEAQQAPPPPVGIADSLYLRAQRLVNEGDTARGRSIVDSLVRTTRDGTDARANALFWRATIAADSSAARRDYLTIVIDYPLSPRTADALLRLGQAEFGWGDRTASLRHLERLVLEHPASEATVDGWIWIGRARIADRELAAGCTALDSARGHVRAGDVERSNQITFARQPCRMLAVAPSTPASPATSPSHPPGGTVSGPPADAASPRRWSAQVAAYKLKADAEKMAKTLSERGYDARVDAVSLFHVRIGSFRTRAEAVAMVANLKQRQITAIVVEATRRAP
jgi:cell division septation protein DedD